MQIWLDNTLAHFDAENADLVLTTCSLLDRIARHAPLHARLINTVSLLEHIGSYKIMSARHFTNIDQATLKHLAEEAHHAYFMKRQAEKTAERQLEYAARDLLAPASARMYFQRLESATVRKLANQDTTGAVYLYMSMITEFRALWFYRVYQQTLQRCSHPMSLKRVFAEEQSHLISMAQRLESGAGISDTCTVELLTQEKRLYCRLLHALQYASTERNVPLSSSGPL